MSTRVYIHVNASNILTEYDPRKRYWLDLVDSMIDEVVETLMFQDAGELGFRCAVQGEGRGSVNGTDHEHTRLTPWCEEPRWKRECSTSTLRLRFR